MSALRKVLFKALPLLLLISTNSYAEKIYELVAHSEGDGKNISMYLQVQNLGPLFLVWDLELSIELMANESTPASKINFSFDDIVSVDKTALVTTKDSHSHKLAQVIAPSQIQIHLSDGSNFVYDELGEFKVVSLNLKSLNSTEGMVLENRYDGLKTPKAIRRADGSPVGDSALNHPLFKHDYLHVLDLGERYYHDEVFEIEDLKLEITEALNLKRRQRLGQVGRPSPLCKSKLTPFYVIEGGKQ